MREHLLLSRSAIKDAVVTEHARRSPVLRGVGHPPRERRVEVAASATAVLIQRVSGGTELHSIAVSARDGDAGSTIQLHLILLFWAKADENPNGLGAAGAGE